MTISVIHANSSFTRAVSDARKNDWMNKPVLHCEEMGNEAIKNDAISIVIWEFR